MATSKCPHCDNRTFELKEITPRNSNYKYNVLQCASCGSVLGVTDYFNIGALLKKDVEPVVNGIRSDLRGVNGNIGNLWNWLQSKLR